MNNVWIFLIALLIVGLAMVVIGVGTDDPIIAFSGNAVAGIACCPAGIIGLISVFALKRAGVL